MKSLGVWLIIFAIGSTLLPLIGMQFILVAWIETWGPTVAWVIRGAMVALGLALIAGAKRND
jgi:hypothetical protein